MKGAIVHFCEGLYHEDHPFRSFRAAISYNSISIDDALDLEMGFSEEDVWDAICDVGKEKAPRADGLNIAFSEHWWDIVKGDIMGFFADFHERGAFEKSLNAIFIGLLPKVVGTYDI